MRTRAQSLLLMLIAGTGSGGLAIAQSISVGQPAPTEEVQVVVPGRLLASNCFQCHGTDGKGPGFDELAGKRASKLFKELMEYRAGDEGEGIMASHSRGYTEAQLRELSDWLSSQR